jgi:hypothetical protein
VIAKPQHANRLRGRFEPFSQLAVPHLFPLPIGQPLPRLTQPLERQQMTLGPQLLCTRTEGFIERFITREWFIADKANMTKAAFCKMLGRQPTGGGQVACDRRQLVVMPIWEAGTPYGGAPQLTKLTRQRLIP